MAPGEILRRSLCSICLIELLGQLSRGGRISSNHGHEHVAAFKQSTEQALRMSRLERGRPKRFRGRPKHVR